MKNLKRLVTLSIAKSLLLAILVTLSLSKGYAQTGDIRARRVIADQAIQLRGTRIDSIQRDTTGWATKTSSVPTAKAVYDFVKANKTDTTSLSERINAKLTKDLSDVNDLNEFCDTCWVPVVKGTTNYKVRGGNIKSTPTLQQVLTSGSTLTSNHVINGKNNFLEFDSATIFMNTYVEGSYFSSFEMNGNEFILAVGNSEYNFANKIVQNAFETSFSRDITVRDEMAGFDERGVSLIDDNITVGERGLYSNGQIIAVYRNDGIYDYYSFAGDALRISSLTGSADFGFPIFNIAGSNTLGISLKEKSGTYQTGIFEPENDYMIAGYDRGEGSIKYKFANEKFWINESAAVDTAMLGTDLYVQPISGLHGRINLWDADLEVFNVIKATENGFLFSNSVGQFSLLTPIENSIIMQKFVGEASLNFPSTSAQSSSDLTMTVSDAEVGNSVILNITSGTTSYYTAWVSATNTVTVRLNNYGSSAVDPAAQNFTATVIK